MRSVNHSAYRQRLSERLGIVPKHFKKNGIIVHAASVGEIIALKSFIQHLLEQFPHTAITVTTFTPTGSAQVKALFADKVQHCYLPLDCIITTRLFLQALQPKALVLMETELWPNLIAQCKTRGSKLLLINGRLSDKSMKSYQKFSYLIAPALQKFDHILCQSQENYLNFLQLGAIPARTEVSGNLKFDIAINDALIARKQELAQLLPTNRASWLVASTHQGDEEIALQAFKDIRQQYPELLLIIVPRHPERFNQVAQLCLEHKFNVVKRSENKALSATDDIWLLDTLGELLAAYALADLVTIGGSFSDIGGHNPLEPALFEKPIIVGPNMSNFREIMVQLKQVNGIAQLEQAQSVSTFEHSQALAKSVRQLLTDQTLASRLGSNAHQVVVTNQGASDYSVNKLCQLLGSVELF